MKLILLVVALLVPSNTLSFTVPSQKVKVQHDISQKMTTSRLDEDGLKMFENWIPIGMTRSTPKDNVIIDADYRLTGVFTLASLLIYYLYPGKVHKSHCFLSEMGLFFFWIPELTRTHKCYNSSLATTYYPGYEEPVYFLTFSGLSALVHLWFGLFLADRAYRIRCVFDNECFQMKNYRDAYGNPRDEILMEQRTKNYVVGGANKWR